MKKEIASAFIAAALILGISASADEFKASCDYVSQKINVTLDTEGKYNDKILFYLIDADKEVSSITSANISEAVFDVREASGSGGVYTLQIPMPTAKAKRYKVIYENYEAVDDVGGTAISQREVTKYIASDSECAELMNLANSATATGIIGVLETNKTILNLEEYTFSEENSDDVTMGVLLTANRPSAGFGNINELLNAFEKAYAAAKIKNASPESIENALINYGGKFGIVLNDDYNAYDEEKGTFIYKDAVNEALSSEYNKLSEDAQLYARLGEIFSEKLALTVLNNSTREKIDKVLHNYNDVFGLDLSGKYAALSTDAKTNFCKALERKDFQTPQQVKDAFDTRLAQTVINPGTGDSGSGGGNGGGGKSSASYTPTVTPPTEPENPEIPSEKFSDLSGSEWAKDAIYALSERKIISGYDDGSFRPNNTITRNEFITMLMIAFDMVDENAEYTFVDGDGGAWYAKYVASAKKAGVVTGYTDGRFGDGENITRQDLAVMVYRLANIEKKETAVSFADDDKISDYAKEAVYTLNSVGIINGMGENNFEPTENATRAQAARILYLALGGADID